ncbi:serine/arginine repetitive matrix protein 2-like [Thrips palmi]|uniref:Serine/arginine repetitive matrix protein 2-like n=1 Tax=Thrips palmi TaxID=161013 RepID=A0A6P8YD77_THRPL|nr:serine/arginine repetitive matrix protein 2-like [Thrips palmi]
MVRSNERTRGRSRSRSPRPSSASYRRGSDRHRRSRSRSPRRRRSPSPSWGRSRRSRRRRSPSRRDSPRRAPSTSRSSNGYRDSHSTSSTSRRGDARDRDSAAPRHPKRGRHSPVRAPDCWDVRGPRPTLVAPVPAPPARVAVREDEAHLRPLEPVATAPQGRLQLSSVVHPATASEADEEDDLDDEEDDVDDVEPPLERPRGSRIAMQCRGRSWSPTRPLSPLRCSITSWRDGGRVVRTVGPAGQQEEEERTTDSAERFRQAMNIERRVKFRVTLNGRSRKGRRRDGRDAPRMLPPDPAVALAAASFMDRMDAGVAAAKRRLRENALQATDAHRNKPWS